MTNAVSLWADFCCKVIFGRVSGERFWGVLNPQGRLVEFWTSNDMASTRNCSFDNSSEARRCLSEKLPECGKSFLFANQDQTNVLLVRFSLSSKITFVCKVWLYPWPQMHAKRFQKQVVWTTKSVSQTQVSWRPKCILSKFMMFQWCWWSPANFDE